jgi:hypothetical protein
VKDIDFPTRTSARTARDIDFPTKTSACTARDIDFPAKTSACTARDIDFPAKTRACTPTTNAHTMRSPDLPTSPDISPKKGELDAGCR